MRHGSETWPVRKENEVAFERAEMRMVRWMCDVKVKDRVPSKELRERLGIDDIILILQQDTSPHHTGKDPSEDRNRNCRRAGRIPTR